MVGPMIWLRASRASRPIRVTVTTSPGPMARRSFSNSCQSARAPVAFSPAARKLVKLRAKGLAVGADTGIAAAAILRVLFGHILRKA